MRLEPIRKSLGISLSGGEKRRVEFARSLSMNPRYLLLDEPFAGVDPLSIQQLQDEIRHISLEYNIGVLISDHNAREILDLCHRVYVIFSGTILAQGSKQEILDNPEVRRVYFGERFA